MELSEYFEPIDQHIVDFEQKKFHPTMGDIISSYVPDGAFPDIEGKQIALLGISEDRASVNNVGCAAAPDYIRHYLYHLAQPAEQPTIVDLGNIAPGRTVNDTYTAVATVMQHLFENGLTVVILGGSDDMVYPVYQTYAALGRVVNIGAVDSKFNLDGGDTINSDNYLQHIIIQQPNFLFDYVNIGYQTYFVGNNMVKLMDELKFTTNRIGKLQSNMEQCEPLVRYCDMVAVDISAVRQSEAPANAAPSPHGFYGEEVCQIMRFAGMSDKTSCIGIFETNPAFDRAGQTCHMLAHAIWFFIEGFAFRQNDFPHRDPQYYKRFAVQLNEMEIVFYKSLKSDRWWIEVPCGDKERRERYLRHTLIPCNYSDYCQAMNNEIPDLWWHYYNRING